MSLTNWLLVFHLWSAFALVAAMVLFWAMVVAARDCDSVEETIAYKRIGNLGNRVVAVGGIGTIVFGVWLAFNKDGYAIWNGWIIAAIVLWIVGMAAGGRAGVEYQKALTRAEELQRSGQPAPPGELRALNRTQTGLILNVIASVAILLVLIDMIWKPGH